MQATIIRKIEKEEIDLPDNRPFYKEASCDPWSSHKAFDRPNAQHTNYELIRVYQQEIGKKGELLNYLVKTDDRKLFNDLIRIGDERLERLVAESVDKIRNKYEIYDIPYCLEEERRRIKKLSWYKRLLNKF